MTLKRQIILAFICIFTLGARGWASGHADAGPCPAPPAIARDLNTSKYAAAQSLLIRQVSKNPNDAQATLWLARSYLNTNNYDQAVTYAERAVQLSADCSEAHFWLARAYALKADRDRSFWLARKSRIEYQAAVQLDPGNLAARRDLMEFYLQAPWILGGSKDKARAQLEAIASRNPLQGDLARAIYWRDLNKPSLAIKEFRKVLAAKPQQAGPYFQAADFYEAQQNPTEMEAAIQDVSRIAPDDPRLNYYSAVADVMKGRSLDKAEHDLKVYLAETPPRNDFPPHASAHDWLGRICEIKGNKEEAIQQFKSALSLSPDNRTAQQALKRLDAN